jgi:hypothetical protein
MFKIDGAKFKKIKSDKHTTTLRHDDGHEVTIVHKHLKPGMLKQLAKLPSVDPEAVKMSDGGQMTSAQKHDEALKVAMSTPKGPEPKAKGDSLLARATDFSHPKGDLANGRMAEGGEIKKPVDKGPYIDPKKAAEFQKGFLNPPSLKEKFVEALHTHGGKRYAEGGDVKPTPKPSEEPAKEKQSKPNGFDEFLGHMHRMGQMLKNGPAYADGGDVEQQPLATEAPQSSDVLKDLDKLKQDESKASGMTPEAEGAMSASSPKDNPDMSRKIALYNSAVMPPIDAKGGIPDADAAVAQSFGPNGEAPKYLNPEAVKTAETSMGAQAAQKMDAKAAAIAQFEEQNRLRAAMGMPQVPMPAELASAAELPSGAPTGLAKPGSEPMAMQMAGDRGLASGAKDAVGAKPPGETDLPGSYDELAHRGMKAIDAEYQAQKAINNANQKSLDDQVKIQNELNIHHGVAEKNINDMITSLSESIRDEKIKPDQVWNEKGAVGKVSTIIGLLLGGLGAGLSRGENQAAKALDNMISADIDAQKANLGKKHNLLSEAIRMMGNERDGYKLATLQLADLTKSKMQAEINKLQNPLMKARAQQQMVEFAAKYMPMHQQLIQSTAAMSLANGAMQDPNKMPALLNQLDKLDPKHAGQIVSQMLTPRNGKIAPALAQQDPAVFVKYMVPGDRQKDVLGEIKRAQDTSQIAPQIMAAAKRAASRNPVEHANGAREFEALINTTVQDLEGTVKQAAIDSIHHNLTPSGITATPGENESKIRAVKEYLGAKASAPTAKAFGIDLNQFGSTSSDPVKRLNPTQQKYADWALNNQHDPKAQLVLKKLGLK